MGMATWKNILMNYRIEKNILPKNCIDHIKSLINNLDFINAGDIVNSKINNIFTPNYIFQGMSRVTTDNININENNKLLYTRLNDFGFIITSIVCEKEKIKIKNIDRFMWNLYKPNEEGTFHVDMVDSSFYTILYSFNDSDGYVQIGDKKIYDVENEAKIFKSNIKHKGVGPTKSNYRLNLNIVLQT